MLAAVTSGLCRRRLPAVVVSVVGGGARRGVSGAVRWLLSPGVWTSQLVCFFIYGGGLPIVPMYASDVSQPAIPAVYLLDTVTIGYGSDDENSIVANSSGAKRLYRHYTGHRHYLTGTIERPPPCMVLCLVETTVLLLWWFAAFLQ